MINGQYVQGLEVYENNGYTMCTICYCKKAELVHPCYYYFCTDCVKNWVCTSIENNKHGDNEEFRCLSNTCAVKLTYKEIQIRLDKKQLNSIQEALNNTYYLKTEDIVKCPKESCDYVGFIQMKAWRENLTCEKWDYQWREFHNLTYVEKAWRSIKETMRLNPESFNYVNEVFSSNPCPQWDMKIYKLEGCSHMVCQKCKYEFCWVCFGNYPGYVHTGGNTICGLRPFVLAISYIMLAIMLFTYSWYSNNWVSYLQRIMLTFLGKLIFANLYGVSIFMTLFFAQCYTGKYTYAYSGWDKLICWIWASLTMGWPIVWGGFATLWYYRLIPGNFVIRYIYNQFYYTIIIALAAIVLALAIGLLYLVSVYLVFKPGRFIVKGVIRGISKCKCPLRSKFNKVKSN